MIARLCASTLPFATVVAPAGYGKTTLLAKWAEADPRPFAWVALDDTPVFMRYIAAAIHRVEPLPPPVFEALSGPGGSTTPVTGAARVVQCAPKVALGYDVDAALERLDT